MEVELMGVKLLAPFYGSYLYVWTAVPGITALGQVLVADVFKNGAGAATNDLMLFINHYYQGA
ncbi:MAG: hypothetical protein Q8N38_11635 [Bacteroidales bacterium]|nr:hypothetical protein [Bacteroidales bacterium]